MKLIASGVANCAGTTRSPSFSRSSSSTRMNIRPLRASSISSSAEERYCDNSLVTNFSCRFSIRRSPPGGRRSARRVSISIFTGSFGLRVPNPVTEAVWGMMFTPKVSPRTSFTVNDTPSTATLPLTAMKREMLGWDTENPACGGVFRRRRERGSDPVDMAGHQVPAEFVADAERSFQIDPRSHRPRPQLGMGEGFGGGIDGEPVGAEFHRGQAAAGAGDRRTQRHRRFRQERGWCFDDQAHVFARADRVDGSDMPEGGYDAGEHGLCLVNSDSMSSPMTVMQSRRKRGMCARVSVPNA